VCAVEHDRKRDGFDTDLLTRAALACAAGEEPMADLNVERRSTRPTMMWGWIGLGILLLGVLAWLVYSFMAMGAEPDPVPVDFERVSWTEVVPPGSSHTNQPSAHLIA
jgi:hypothetical protein